MNAILKIGLVFLVIILIGYLSFQLVSKWNSKITIVTTYNHLPNCQLYTVDNIPVSLHDLHYKQLLLVLFDPECEHCLYEIRDLKSQQEKLKNVEIILITTVNNFDILNFINSQELEKYSRIRVLGCDQDDLFKAFGNTPIPTIFIYGDDKKLKKVFKGEVKIEAIINALNHN